LAGAVDGWSPTGGRFVDVAPSEAPCEHWGLAGRLGFKVLEERCTAPEHSLKS
jgi:hypothetical protein